MNAKTFLKKRVDVVKEIQKSLKRSVKLSDGSHACINNQTNILANTFKILSRIGSGSINGEAFKICYPLECDQRNCKCKDNPMHLAVKRIPITEGDMKLSRNPLSRNALKSELWAELLFMRLCNALVENKVTPCLPLYTNYFMCDSCTYVNDALIERFPTGSPCIILINELATAGDMKTWSAQHRSTDLWINAYFQIYTALYALQKYFDMTHHDLHWGNVLVHEIPKGGYWRYLIDGQIYDVPNMGFLFTLWDFGYARIPGKVEIDAWQWYYEEDSQKPRSLVDYMRISNVPVWRSTDSQHPVKMSQSLQDFVHNVTSMYEDGAPIQSIITTWQEIYAKSESHDKEILEEYSFDKKLMMDKQLYQFLHPVTRQALMIPTRSQVKAQKDLRDLLKYDVNIVPRQNMLTYMQNLKVSKKTLAYDPSKRYKKGDIMTYNGNVFIAKVDNPSSNLEWEHLGSEHEIDLSRFLDVDSNMKLSTPLVTTANENELQQKRYNAGEIIDIDGHILIAKRDNADIENIDDWDYIEYTGMNDNLNTAFKNDSGNAFKNDSGNAFKNDSGNAFKDSSGKISSSSMFSGSPLSQQTHSFRQSTSVSKDINNGPPLPSDLHSDSNESLVSYRW